MEKIRVLYIAGSGRSGSTLLERILGQVTGVFSAGELRYIWERGFKENQLCGCGSPFKDCDMWRRIVKRAFEYPERISGNINSIIGMQNSLDRIRYMPFLGSDKFKKGLRSLCEDYLYPLYSAILKESGKEIIIDSSKHPSYLDILSRCEFIDLYIIHLVRDSRAVAYSWQKKKIRPEVTGKQQYMPRYRPMVTSFHWLINDYLIRKIARKTKYMLLRYEDFVNGPKESIEKILSFMGTTDELSFFVDGRTVPIGVNHTVSGNPMRFKTTDLEIKSDTEWLMEMAWKDRLLVSLITYPVMRRLYPEVSLFDRHMER